MSVERAVIVLFIVVTYSLFNAALVHGDYLFSFSLSQFSLTANRLANGSCCVPHQHSLICLAHCSVKLLYCFRPPHYPLTASDSDCPLLALVSKVTNAGRTLAIPGPWMGGTQLLMKVEHIGDNIFDNNQLIDRVFFELSLLVQDTPRTLFSMGEEGYVTARVSDVSVACDGSFCGSNCNYLDRDDSSGHFTCTENGIVCLDGYQYPGTNCTDCVPAPGCSPIGGFCSLPFECKCRVGFTGDHCDQEEGDDSLSVTTVHSTSTETVLHSSVDAISPTSSTVTVGTTTTDASTETTTTTTETSSGISTTSTASVTAAGDTSSSTSSSISDTNTHTTTSGTVSSGERFVTSKALDQTKQSMFASPSSADLTPGSDSGLSHSTILLIVGSASGALFCLIVLCIVLVITILCSKRIRRRGKYSVKTNIRLWDIKIKDPALLSPLTPTNKDSNKQPQQPQHNIFEDLVVTNPNAHDNVDYSSIQHPSLSPLQMHTLQQPLNYATLDHSEAARLRQMFNPFSSTSECPPQ